MCDTNCCMLTLAVVVHLESTYLSAVIVFCAMPVTSAKPFLLFLIILLILIPKLDKIVKWIWR